MSFIDKGDLRMGFWLGLGLLGAFLLLGILQYGLMRAAGRDRSV